MRRMKIQGDSNDIKQKHHYIKLILLLQLLFDIDIKNIKYIFFVSIILLIILITINDFFYHKNIINLKPLTKYIRDCKKLINYNRTKIYNKHPYIAICLSVLNMENYIEKNLLSILNQSFQDFEIIIINNDSKDETENIVKRIQLTEDRIKLISHSKNLGRFRAYIESILNSESEFILLMEPKDMYLNENLFQKLHDYNMKNNFDIIEFSVYYQFDGKNKIFYQDNNFVTHYHKFNKNIIYQPELSNILYYKPGTKEYSQTICRNILNKFIRREIFIHIKNYIGKEYYRKYIIKADDMIMNVVSYEYANNYTNIYLPGYLNIIRKEMYRDDEKGKLKRIRTVEHFFYFKLFYKYLKDYNKNKNFLFYEMRDLHHFILEIKDSKIIQYILLQKNLIYQIMQETNLSNDFQLYLQNLMNYYQN